MLPEIHFPSHLSIYNSTLQLLLDPEEFSKFQEIVSSVCQEFPSVTGVLLTGSLVQQIRLPYLSEHFYRPSTDLASAYELVVNRAKKKIWPHKDSDLDMWICTEDLHDSENIRKTLDERALELLEWLNEHPSAPTTDWIEKKKAAFDEFYKKPEFYPKEWICHNGAQPWLAEGFKRSLVKKIVDILPKLVEKVNYYFRKGFAHEFLETRAYPACTFNLRPEKIETEDGGYDRTPFAYYLKDWVDLETNCMILYRSEDALAELPYPFNPKGYILGQTIADTIGWKSFHERGNMLRWSRNGYIRPSEGILGRFLYLYSYPWSNDKG